MGQVTSKGNEWEVKDETPVGYAHAKILTWVVVICGPTHYQLDHGGALTITGEVVYACTIFWL